MMIDPTKKSNMGKGKGEKEEQHDSEGKKKETYNTGDSPVVTHLSTSPAITGLTRGERTGSRIFQCLWSYVMEP